MSNNSKTCGAICTPWNPKDWNTPVKVPDGMDPALYNVLNGCWLCNYDKEIMENNYLMERSFFNGIEGPPCNKSSIIIPKNSKDE